MDSAAVLPDKDGPLIRKVSPATQAREQRGLTLVVMTYMMLELQLEDRSL
jgi:hypothetical protein